MHCILCKIHPILQRFFALVMENNLNIAWHPSVLYTNFTCFLAKCETKKYEKSARINKYKKGKIFTKQIQ